MSTFTVPITSSSRYMCTDLLSTIGSGVRVGTHGIVLGTGVITRVGGTYTVVGRMTGTGITVTPSIIITTGAHSTTDMLRIMDIMTCTVAYRIASMQWPTLTVRSVTATPV